MSSTGKEQRYHQCQYHFPATTIIFPGFHSLLSAHGQRDPTSGFKERHDPHSAQVQQGNADG